MRKAIIAGAVLFCLMIVFLVFLMQGINSQYKNHIDKVQLNIGKKVILYKDTLLIINYSIIDNTYTLSNGVKVASELIEQIKIK